VVNQIVQPIRGGGQRLRFRRALFLAEAGVTIGRHTHPGIESAYILEGGFDLPIEGQPTRAYKPGDGFVIPPGTPHTGGKNGDAKTRVLSTYIVEKGKPLASPA
jgi:quercetin dioxygenase-like cupin family protein